MDFFGQLTQDTRHPDTELLYLQNRRKMRTYLVAALVVAVVACLTCEVSAAGYGGGLTFRHQVPRYATRTFVQPYMIGGSQQAYSNFAPSFVSGGYRPSHLSGFSSGGIFPGGLSWIWLLIIGLILLSVLADK